MQIDFGQVKDVADFSSVPRGRYVVKIAEVREGVTQEGSPRWAVRLEVASGEFTGRTAAWDGLVWSDKGLRRVKHVLEKLGFDVSGGLEIASTQLIGLEVLAEIGIEEREDPKTGTRMIQPRVPYFGYESVTANGK